MSEIRGSNLIVLAEQVELFSVAIPDTLAGQTIEASKIEQDFDLHVAAIQRGERLDPKLSGDTTLPPGGELLMLGGSEQRRRFHRHYF